MSTLVFTTVAWLVVGCFTVYTICWVEEDVIKVKDLPTLALHACLGPIVLIFFLAHKCNETGLSTKVVFDFRKDKSNDD